MRILLAALTVCITGTPAHAETWKQHPHNPVLKPTLAWEGKAVYEPSVRYENGRYRMWYTAGWGYKAAIGYATSRDGIHWRKRSTPVLGQGHGGQKGHANRVEVTRHHGVYFMFYVGPPELGKEPLRVATSRDGIHWRSRGVALRAGAWNTAMANTHVFRSQGRWRMLYEGKVGEGWHTALTSSRTPLRWQHTQTPLQGLGFPGGMYGGPTLKRRDGVWHLYYHASPEGQTPLPTDIYHTSSRDLRRWTPGVKVIGRDQAWEFDQVADPALAHGLMFFDGDDNVNETAAIGMARRN